MGSEGSSDFSAQQKQQECAGEDDAGSTAQPVASDAVHKISHDLRGDEYHSQSPSPKTAAEPPESCGGEESAEEEEENPNRTAQWGELFVGCRIESPRTIQDRSSPKQSGCSETRHGSAEEQEDADRGEAKQPAAEHRIRGGAGVVSHDLNIDS